MTYLYYFTCDRKKRNLILIFQYVCVMLQLLKITFIAFSLLFVANISHANTCANDLSECTPKNLCEIATVKSDGIFSWSHLSKAKKHVTLAKNLGMDCGVKNSRTCPGNIKICTTSELCKKATVVSGSSKRWTNYNAVLKNNLSFVAEINPLFIKSFDIKNFSNQSLSSVSA